MIFLNKEIKIVRQEQDIVLKFVVVKRTKQECKTGKKKKNLHLKLINQLNNLSYCLHLKSH